MRYLIDGYNLLFKLGMQQGSPDRARLRLCDFLADLFGDRADRATVVFDARRLPPGVRAEQVHRGLRVLFSVQRPSADEMIADLVLQESRPADLAVVSDDRQVRLAARQGGARDLTAAAFLDEMERPAGRHGAAGEGGALPEKPDAASAAERHRWLEIFGGLEADPDLRDAFRKRDF